MILFYVSLVFLGMSAAWYNLDSRNSRLELRRPLRQTVVSSEYQIKKPVKLTNATPSWEAPPRQSWDDEAIFEIFSPPKIYFNPVENTFVLEPPIQLPERSDGFGLELAGFSRLPYRLQYKGFAGQEGDYHILLRNEETGEDLRVKVGNYLEEEDISILSFDVDRRMSSDPDGSTVLRESVRLQILDTRLGEKINLGPEIRYNRRIGAIFRTIGLKPQTFTLEPGQRHLFDGTVFTLHEVDFDRKSVLMQSADPESGLTEWRTLFLIKDDTSDTASSVPVDDFEKAIVQQDFPLPNIKN